MRSIKTQQLKTELSPVAFEVTPPFLRQTYFAGLSGCSQCWQLLLHSTVSESPHLLRRDLILLPVVSGAVPSVLSIAPNTAGGFLPATPSKNRNKIRKELINLKLLALLTSGSFLNMTSAQVVETSVINTSSSQSFPRPDDHTNYQMAIFLMQRTKTFINLV